MSHFKGHFGGGQDFFDPLNCPERSEGQFRGQKSRCVCCVLLCVVGCSCVLLCVVAC
jgi:hypothetical protein